MTAWRQVALLFVMALSAVAASLALLGVVRTGVPAKQRQHNAVTAALYVIAGWVAWQVLR